MDSKAPRKDTQPSWFDLAVFAVVAAFFLFCARGLTRNSLADRGPAEPAPTRLLPDRTLASAPSAVASAASATHGIEVFRLDCLFSGPPPTITTQAKMVRIMTSLCGDAKVPAKDTAFTGKNETSGEDVIPFLQEGNAVSTNYFTLLDGRNQVSFRLTTGRGRELRQSVTLIRSAKPE